MFGKITLSILIFFSIILAFHPAKALAHFVKADNGIGAVLHIDPEDDPIAGEQTTMFLEFKDTAGKFDIANCICKVTITEADAELLGQSFEGAGGTEKLSAVIPFTFPKKDIYKLKIEGTPKNANDFKAFTLNYDVRVARESERDGNTQDSKEEQSFWRPNIIYIAGGLIIAAFLAGALFFKENKNERG